MFGFVVDSDADKGKGGNVTAKPSFAVETSPGNYHLWFLFTRAIPAAQAKLIGDAIRASSGADQDTGVVTQCYRVAGTPNFPSAAKRARGRITVEPTRIVRAHRPAVGSRRAAGGDSPRRYTVGPQARAPRRVIPTRQRSRMTCLRSSATALSPRRPLHFVSQCGSAARAAALDHRRHRRAAREVSERDRQEVHQAPAQGGRALLWQGRGAARRRQRSVPAPLPRPPARLCARSERRLHTHVIPTIRLVAGQLPAIAEEIARADRPGSPIFARAGTLVEPVCETMTAADGRKTVTARLRPLSVDSLL